MPTCPASFSPLERAELRIGVKLAEIVACRETTTKEARGDYDSKDGSNRGEENLLPEFSGREWGDKAVLITA